MLSVKIKTVIGLLTVAATVVAIYTAYDAGHTAGRDEVLSQQRAEADANLLQRVAHLQQRLDDATAKRKDAQRRAIALANQIEQAQKQEISPHEVKQIVEVNDCKRLGADFVRLFNRIHAPDADSGAGSQ